MNVCGAEWIFASFSGPVSWCLISNNLKNVVSYNFGYIYCFSFLFFCHSVPINTFEVDTVFVAVVV